MTAGILVALVVLAAFGIVFAIEATERGGRLWQKRWCKRHGLAMREQVTPLGGGATLWWGEDAGGNEYVPGADDEPVKIKEGGANG